jgi:hypothetical protein
MSEIKGDKPLELNKENASDFLEGYDVGYSPSRYTTNNSDAYRAGYEAGRLKMRKDDYGNHVPSGGVIG